MILGVCLILNGFPSWGALLFLRRLDWTSFGDRPCIQNFLEIGVAPYAGMPRASREV